MNAVDMAAFTAPKSDQLNADDLIGGPRTITVTGVRANAGSAEQPVDISYEGDNGKPYKPCKSMRRVMVHIWGADARNYVGRSMTLYCDPNVQFGGMKVGGIRISHMSHIDKTQTMALTATRAKRAPFTVHPLVMPVPFDVGKMIADYEAAANAEAVEALEALRAAHWKAMPAEDKTRVKAASDAAKARLTQQQEAAQ
jgi:hypothetical protein